jgi:RimJ/RimL family protein N-acetyltransferase
MQYILSTERLSLRKLTHADWSFILELVNTEGWIKFIGDRNVHSEADALRYLNNGPLASYRENDFGLWLVESKGGEKIGLCGILTRAYLQNPDVGFAFLPEYTGKGFAIEIVKATIQYAMKHWQFEKISAIIIPTNERSINLVERLGFAFVERFKHENETLLLFTYG